MQQTSAPEDFFAEGYLFLHPEANSYAGGAWQHYCDHGKSLGFSMGYPDVQQFNAPEYLEINPDVRSSGEDPWRHYVLHGAEEGRSNCVGLEEEKAAFFPEGYLFLYPEIRKAGFEAWSHYVRFGKNEGRTPGTPGKRQFNAERYLEKYPDVRESGTDPWHHYVLKGFWEHRENCVPPAISVCVPVYNAERYLEQCLDSLLAQTFADFEVICVDDGSVDDSYSILHKYAELDKRIQVYHQINSGAAAARNFAMDKAIGDYLAFLDADDYADPQLLEKTYNWAEYVNADVVGFCNWYVREGQEPVKNIWALRDYAMPDGLEVFSWRDYPDSILDVIAPAPWNKLYRRSLIVENNLHFQNLRAFNDLYFCTMVLVLADRVTCLREQLVYYRIDSTKSISTKKIESFDNMVAAQQQIVEHCQRLPYYDRVKNAVSNCAVNLYVYYYEEFLRPLKSQNNFSLRERIRHLLEDNKDNLVFASFCKFINACCRILYRILNIFIMIISKPFEVLLTKEERLYKKACYDIQSILSSEFYQDIESEKLFPFLQGRFKKLQYNINNSYFEYIKEGIRIFVNNISKFFLNHCYKSDVSNSLNTLHTKIQIIEAKLKNDNCNQLSTLKSQVDGLREHINKQEQLLAVLSTPVPEGTALLVEPNDCHGEVLPGFVDYLFQLGFRVDVLITDEQAKRQPLCRIDDTRMRVFALPWNVLGQVVQSARMTNYEVAVFTSYTMYHWLGDNHYPAVTEHFPNIVSARRGNYFVSHHLELTPRDLLMSGHIFTLAHMPCLGALDCVVNPHYFGPVKEHIKSRGITQFILVGAMEKERRNCELLLDAVRELLRAGRIDFKVTIIGRGDDSWIPKDLHNVINWLGALDYPKMYDHMEDADFFLPLFDPDDPEHERYLTTATSGSFQLMRGFGVPGILPRKFAVPHGFTEQDSILYTTNADLFCAMVKAMDMSNMAYKETRQNLLHVATQLSERSLHTLTSALERFKPTLRES